MYLSSYNIWSNSTIGSEDNKKEETNFNQREREREEEEEQQQQQQHSRIICYSKHNDKMYIRTPFVEFYN